jgi:hypothetical protein
MEGSAGPIADLNLPLRFLKRYPLAVGEALDA